MTPGDITESLKTHYSRTFDEHGPTSRGVDWGKREDAELRCSKMLAVMDEDRRLDGIPSLLDVGCGYGALLDTLHQHGIDAHYTGIDVCANMIAWARQNQQTGEFVEGDVLTSLSGRTFDYVVCNGILTQKLETSIMAMDDYAQRLVERMFALCRRGIAFNVMTTKVNFMVPNLYYRNPVEFIAWCLAEITPKVRLDHAYPLYEYTLYLYRTD